MIRDPLFYALAIPAVTLLGFAKGGFAGVGAIAMPLLALVLPPVQAAAILLPLFIAQDLVSVWSFRKTWDRRIVAVMLPGGVIGVFLGYVLAAKVSSTTVLAVLGAISILFAAHRLWLARGGRVAAPRNIPASVDTGLGMALGAVAGFTSQIAHAGGPPFQMWVLPKKLPPASLVGTTAIFFAVLNWIKVPSYWALGQLTPQNLWTAAVLLPVALASTFAGVWLVRRIDLGRFYTVIYIFMIVVGVQLLWKACSPG